MKEHTTSIPRGFNPLLIPGKDGFINLTGPLYLSHEGDTVLMGFLAEKRHVNLQGVCHGGMMATFCDMLLPMSVKHLHSEMRNRFVTTVSLQIDYIAAAPLGAWVQGEIEILRMTHSMVFARALVTADGVLVARVSGISKLGKEIPVELRPQTLPAQHP